MKQFCLCLMVCLFMVGCQTVTPQDRATIFYERATFPEKLQQDTGTLKEPILQHGRCNLYLGTPGATTNTNFRFCTYALTENHLLVQEWDVVNMKYKQLMDIDLARLTSVDLAVYFRTKQVKLLETQRLVGITAIIDEGGLVDGESTEKMFQTIKARGIPSTGDNQLLRGVSSPAPVMMTPIIIPRRR